MRLKKRIKHRLLIISTLILLLISFLVSASNEKSFQRIATFPVFLNSSIEDETVAEIVAASKNGKTLIYTDGKMEAIGFVDIENAKKPKPAGLLPVGGEPTSVTVKNKYALVAVNTSLDFVNVSGKLVVVDIKSRNIKRTIALGGQPDSIAVSPDGKYAAIVIENERDEDLNDGMLPQLPAGQLIIVDLQGHPSNWSTRSVNLSNLPGMLYPTDPEPEYVDINRNNIAVITLQENNHIVLVDLETGNIQNHFSAGTQDLTQIDIADDKLITFGASLSNVPREPDGVSWIDDYHFVTADEGDLAGGTRGFTIYHMDSSIVFESGNQVEHTIVHHGHYPDKRSDNKGNESENVDVGTFKGNKYLFVGSERASVVLVYDINEPTEPKFKQILPSTVKPEGLLAIPERKLLIAAGEEDARDDKIRSALTIYKYRSGDASYPTIISGNRADGTPLPWGALSGLAADPNEENTLYTIHDSFYDQARIFKLNIDDQPAVVETEILLIDSMKKLAAIDTSMVNPDGTVNIDQEGIAVRKSGGFWIASEGAGTIGDSDRPFETFNLILGVLPSGDIDQVIQLPVSTNGRQVRFGFEGVTSTGTIDNEVLYVAFQREWTDDIDGHVRIGRYDVAKEKWHFYYYPLEMPMSAAGGWVGLSEITALDHENFLVIERDNQANADAAIKSIYQFSTTGLTPLEDPAVGTLPNFPVVKKTLVRDLMKDLAKTKGLILEKIEGMTVTKSGDLYIVNDNDGVDDSNGETQLLKIHVD
jgi:phytase-like protein